MLENNKCRLCGEIVDHMLSECGKLTQKEYKSGHDWVVKVIHWELCKRLKYKSGHDIAGKVKISYKQISICTKRIYPRK